MAAISRDFVTKNGIVIEGDSEVTSSTNQVSALQAAGGAAIAKNLIVGSTATIYGDTNLIGSLSVGSQTNVSGSIFPTVGGLDLGTLALPFSKLYLNTDDSLYLGSVIVSSTGSSVTFSSDLGPTTLNVELAKLSGSVNSTSTDSGSLQVVGGIGVSEDIYAGGSINVQQNLSVTGTSVVHQTLSVLSTASSTSTIANNAVYVQGGVGIGSELVVNGVAVFNNDVYFQGATTFVYSTNSVYTDNLIELHVPPGGVDSTWIFNDNKDIGLRFHYYGSTNSNAALVLSNSSKNLEFFIEGTETNGVFTGTYGTLKIGGLDVTGDATATNLSFTGSINTSGLVYQDATGKLVSQGNITYNTSTQELSGTISQANNINGGVYGSIPIQYGTSQTTFIAPGTGDFQVLTWNDATTSASWQAAGSTAVGYANTATNLGGGAPGSLVYQTGPGATDFLSAGGNGYVLIYNTATSAPEWTDPGNFTVGYANTATTSTYASTATFAFTATYADIASTSTYAYTATYASTASYAIEAGTSTYASTASYAIEAGTSTYASTASFAIEAGTSTYASTASYAIEAGTSTYAYTATHAFTATFADIANTSTYAFTATYADSANYTISAGTSTYASSATYAEVAGTSTYAYTATYASTASFAIEAGTSTYAFTSTNISGGQSGDLLYQSSTGTTNFLNIGTSSYLLTSDGTAPTWSSLTDLSQSVTTYADNVKNGTAGQLVYQISTSTSGFAGPGTAGQILLSSGTSAPVYTDTSSIYVGHAVLADTATYASTASFAIVAGTSTFALTATYSANILGGATGSIAYQSTADTTTFLAGGSNGDLLRYFNNAPVWSTTASLSGGTASSSTVGQQSLIVTNGGIGVTGDSYFADNVVISASVFSNGAQVITTATVNEYANQTIITAGTDTAVNTSTGNVIIWNTSTLQSVTSRGATTDQQISVTNITSATSTNSGALQVTGGVGIGGNLVVGGTIYGTATTATTATNLAGGTAGQLAYQTAPGLTGFVNVGVAGEVLISNGTSAPSYSNSLTLASTASSTSSVTANALYVAGGVGIGSSLFVTGPAIFNDNVIFSGTATYVYSTNTVYTDNLINLHVPVGSTGTNHDWLVDDGKDIGLVFHYYTGTDYNAFLGLANNSKYLEWYDRGDEVGDVFTGTRYGVFKTGGIILTHTTASNSSSTGALTVAGGVGIRGDLYVGGFSYSGGAQVITTATVNEYANQTVITAGTDTAVSTSTGNVTISNTSTLQTVTSRGATTNNAITITNATTATNTSSGALVVAGGVGIGGSVFVNQTATVVSSLNATSTASGALQVIGGVGIGRDLYVGGTIYGTILGTISTATNIAGGTAGQVPYQTAPGQTSFYGPGTAGNILVSNGTGAPTYNNTLTLTSINVSTSTTTGALQVAGGVGVGGALYIGTSSYVNNSLILTTATIATYAVTSLTAGTDTAVNTTTGAVVIWNTSTLQSVTSRGATTNQAISITNTAVSGSTATGALQITGGAGIGGNLVVGGSSTITNSLKVAGLTASTSTTTGAVQVSGGVGVGGSVYVGNRVGFVGTNSASVVYQIYNAATNSLDTVFG
jgi:fibronectin-binding autotransporter adhesin